MTDAPDQPTPPRIEHHASGDLGIGDSTPRLSWMVPRAAPGYRQARYELVGWTETADGVRETVTALVESGDQVMCPWPWAALRSREAFGVRVRVQGETGPWSPWSEEGTAEVGLLESDDWHADLVGPDDDRVDPAERRPALVRRVFRLGEEPRAARLYVTAHGLAEVEINGIRVGDDALVPGWSSYRHRLRYHTYDVAHLLRPGDNVIGAWLADGWYRGRLGFHGGTPDVFGSDLALAAQLEVLSESGRSVAVTTDDEWRTSPGPLLASGIYDGETYDARLEQPGWSAPGFDDTAWAQVRCRTLDPGVLASPDGPPVRCTEELSPVHITRLDADRHLVDFGQNHAGRLRVRVRGAAGQEIRLRHAEVLEGGELGARTLRGAAATDLLILADAQEKVWEPRFTLHGYRYAEVSGWPGDLQPEDLVSRVYHSDMARQGWFWCSDPLVSRLHDNIVWTMRSNFVDVPTDCPQRDERFGWTGDIQVFGPTASFLYDVSGVLGDWLRSLAAEQEEYGTVPWYVPFVPAPGWDPAVPGAVWGDAAVLLPWALYTATGDQGVLERQYSSARAWVDQVAELAGPGHLWDTGFQLGDWLDPSAPHDDPTLAVTDPYLVASAYFAHSARRLADMATVLARPGDAQRYTRLAEQVRAAFATAYLGRDAPPDARTQTAFALALTFDLCPDEETRRRVAEDLAELVRESGGTVSTGFAGTPVVCDALSASGHLDEAYLLLLERRCPSWLYAVTMGATTTWERWDSLLPDGRVNPGDMNSFNHYALGAVADWMHRVVAGLAPAEPGYRRIRLAPRPGGGLTSAGARHLTPYGEASIAWELEEDDLVVRARVPVGTTATLDLPGLVRELQAGEHEIRHMLRA